MKCGEKTEVYSRVTGYFRPVSNWNRGKQEEFRERKTYRVGKAVAILAALLVLALAAGCAAAGGKCATGDRPRAEAREPAHPPQWAASHRPRTVE